MSSRARSGLAILTIAVLSAVYAHGALTALERRLEDPERAEKMLTGDSKHYIAMAEGFSEGRYFDGYVTVSPHRQPLYPALAGAHDTGSRRRLCTPRHRQHPRGVGDDLDALLPGTLDLPRSGRGSRRGARLCDESLHSQSRS